MRDEKPEVIIPPAIYAQLMALLQGARTENALAVMPVTERATGEPAYLLVVAHVTGDRLQLRPVGVALTIVEIHQRYAPTPGVTDELLGTQEPS